MFRTSRKIQLQKDLKYLFLIDLAAAFSKKEIDEIFDFLILTKDFKAQRYISSRLFVLKSN
jgi:hypothetical protein